MLGSSSNEVVGSSSCWKVGASGWVRDEGIRCGDGDGGYGGGFTDVMHC